MKMREKKANYLARMSEQQKEAMRMKDKERKKAKREAAKMAKNIKPVTMYKTKPALSKATTKAFRALPSDLERAHEVVQGLARRVEEALGPFFLFYLIPPSLPPGVMTKVVARKSRLPWTLPSLVLLLVLA